VNTVTNLCILDRQSDWPLFKNILHHSWAA